MKRMTKSFLMVFLALLLLVQPAMASQPDEAYTYNLEGKAVPSVNVFQVVEIINGSVMGCSDLKAAQDIFVDAQDRVFILDTGNQRVLVLDEKYRCIRELKEFRYNDQILTLADGAQGIFFRDATQMLYIADTKNNRILMTDLDGNVETVYEKPVSPLLDATLPYAPRKIIVDNLGLMYVTSTNVNTGALMIDKNNNFLGFYGTNTIKETFEIKMEYWWRSILTDEQNALSGMSFQPAELSNIFWSEDRFVYAVSPAKDSVSSPVVKLNALGKNIFPSGAEFGDLADSSQSQYERFVFADITVDNEGVFTVLDMYRGKLYQYSPECDLLAVFGGLGSQKGLFKLPVSIESDSKNHILVLDAEKNTVTVMGQTLYGEEIRKAIVLHNEGLYAEALAPWNDIIRMNANYQLAYVGIGKAYMLMEEYEQARDAFKLAEDRESYSEAKEAVRTESLRDNFALIAGIVLTLMVTILCWDLIKKLILLLMRTAKKGKGGAE